MNARDRLNEWIDFARSKSRVSADNMFRHGEVIYSFDKHPRRLGNGALVGRFYAQSLNESPTDIGGYKIAADGTVVAYPDELEGVLPVGELKAPEPRLNPFNTEDMEVA